MFLVIFALGLYAVAGGLIWRQASARRAAPGRLRGRLNAASIRLIMGAAVCLHGAQLYRSGYVEGALNLALGHVVSLVAWMTAALFVAVTMARRDILNLGMVVMPWAAAGLLLGCLLPGADFLLHDLPAGIGRHLAIAIPAYGVLSIAFAQALLLWIQERQLMRPHPGRFFSNLPAMETMESNLFQLTWLGFILLSANLLTGMHNAHQNHGALLLFNHHVLLAVLAWGGFGALLLGRRLFGWRGRLAAQCTMGAFAVLALAYFGTRLVSEVILGR